MSRNTLWATRHEGTRMSSSIAQRAQVIRARLVEDAAVRWLAIVGTALLLMATVFAILAFTQQSRAASLADELRQKDAALTAAADELDGLREDVAKYEPVYLQSKRLDDRETAVSARENALTAREKEADASEASLTTRETAVQDRERKAAENANASDWWVQEVRECLARSGANRVATVTEGSLVGRDTTCYTQ